MRPRRALIVALAAALLVPAAAGATPDELPPLHPVTEDRFQALPMETEMIDTRGGRVYVEVIRPDVPEGTRVPVILTFTPYQVFLSSADDAVASFFVPKGYARAMAHVPGTGNSGGCWDHGGPRERAAGYDLVEWLGTMEWASGRVGMIGGSYEGTTANMAAVDRPPHLATIVPEVAIAQWYGYSYADGVRYLIVDPGQNQSVVINEQGFDTPLAFDFAIGLAPPLNPTDPDHLGRAVERLCPGGDKLVHTEHGYDMEPDFDEFWQERSYLRDASRVRVPVLVQGGWRDYNVKSHESTRWFEALPQRVPKMLVMDAVAHGTPQDPRIRWQTLLHAWFDRWLYGFDTGISDQPPVLSKANDGELRADTRWPPAGTQPARLFLHGDGRLATAPVEGPQALGSFRDSAKTTESEALARRASDGGDFLWFESAPLTEDMRIAGTPRLSLHATSSATSTHFTPVLFDLGPPLTDRPQCRFVPPQQACTVDRGFLNARYRDGLEEGKDLVPGEPYHATVRFIGNDWMVPAGHRIGLAVMSANLWWAVPDDQRAENTLHAGPGARTALILPVVGGTATARAAGL
ncbi:MAG: CocE/NonD family hydrolase [Actinomycetota bacterium]